MIPVMSFAVHVTYTCPLACAHCCFSSSPSNRDRLHADHIRSTLEALPSTIGLVAFTGGEPFLLGRKLDDLVRLAASRGFTTRIVTSAYWARSERKAAERLEPLRDAGLNELSISWDDFHEEFVSFDRVHQAFWAAKQLGITVAVNTVQAKESRWSTDRVSRELGLPPDAPEILVESPLNLTGRAEEELGEEGLRSTRALGPCPYVLTGPTLSAKNKLLACCGVIPDTPELVLDPDFHPDNLQAAIERGMRSALLNWIFLRGPYAVMEWISQRYDIPIASRNQVGGNCEACHRLFTTPEIRARIPDAVAEKAKEITAEMDVLDALGLLHPAALQHLWHSESLVMDTTPLP